MKHLQKMIAGMTMLAILLALISCTHTPVPASPTSKPVITFAIPSSLMDDYQPVVNKFNLQYPSFTVEMVQLPETTNPQEITGTADTIVLLDQSYVLENGGIYFLDLSSFEAKDSTFDTGNFWPKSIDGCKGGSGREFGLPIFIKPTGIYFREKAFDAAGLPYPQPGWTWDDFLKDVNALARTENGQQVYGFADDSFFETLDETLLSSTISYLLQKTGGGIDPPNLTSQLQWYIDLVRSKTLISENIYPLQSPTHNPGSEATWSEAWNTTWKNAQSLFSNNPPAMWKGNLESYYWADLSIEALPDGSIYGSQSSRIIRLRDTKFIGWAPFPVSEQNDATTPMSVTCAVISSNTRYPSESWTWINYLASHTVIPYWSAAVPAQLSVVDASGYWGKLEEKTHLSVQYALEHGWYYNPFKQEVLLVNRALLQAVTQGTDLQTALEQIKNQVEAVASPTP